MSTSRTLLWSSALLGSVLFVFGTAAGCSDDPSDDPQNDAGGSSSSSSSGGASSSSGGSSSSSGGSSSGGSSSGGDAGKDGGTSIPIPSGATLTWTAKGGMPGPPNDASTCHQADDTYVYELASKSLRWKLCQPIPGIPEDPAYAFQEGTATLSAAQDGAIHGALDGVILNTTIGCGADKPYLKLQVTEPNDAITTYDDQFYHCEDDGKSYVDGLDELGAAFRAAVTE